MLTEYGITNFKAFSDRQHIPVSPITLIYGQNSSGKSCILQSLLLLKQTIESAEDPSELLLPRNNLVDLGNYKNFINSHDVNKPFSFKVKLSTFDQKHSLHPSLASALKRTEANTLGFQIEFGCDSKTSIVRLNSFDLYIGKTQEPILSYRTEKKTQKEITGNSMFSSESRPNIGESVFKVSYLNKHHPFFITLWEISKDRIEKKMREWSEYLKQQREQARDIQDSLVKPMYGSDETPIREWELKDKLNDLAAKIENSAEIIKDLNNSTLEEAIKNIEKINKHDFLFCKNFLPVDVGYEGHEGKEDNVDISLDCPDYTNYFREEYKLLHHMVVRVCALFEEIIKNTVYIAPLRNYPERYYIFSGNLTERIGKTGKMVPDILFSNPVFLAKVNKQFDAFDLKYDLKTSPISDLVDLFSLSLVDKLTKVEASIIDVGFGVSQVLPIIVQSMLSQNKMIIIEQPEIHLHPRLQAELGSLIAECSSASHENGNQFLIETHSQHIILRLQKLIRQGKLDHKLVSVIYVDRTAKGSKCLTLRLDKDGDFIDEWPGGFFEEGYNELFS